ncbi:hypothetical protein [uncultured Brachyspira sp.]|uniref:type III-A CRISPR-associated CARF protein Csm6 n=1 Tax=uncultured Brachyspira sp. TaxID=221953 RepID=UPI002630C85A|nr:hypothetical protein [uncultured Brachyspira sp.]
MSEKNNDSQKKYVLFTPVGGNDPVGDEYYKDDMIEEIKKKLSEGKISQDKSDELIKYIESKRSKEPIFMEGAILHIVRHYKPECVVLLFTNSKEEVDEKYDILKDNIQKLSKDCEIIKIEDFDKDYIHDWKHTIDDFNGKLESIPQKYKEHKILINITSSTPQINFKLCLEALNNDKLIPVQVLVSLDDLHTGEKNVKREVCKIYEEYEEIVIRCVEPDIHSIRKPKIKSQLHSLISTGDVDKNGKYNYHTAYNLLKNDKHIKKALMNEIEKARDRVNLNYENDIKEYKLKEMNRFREYYFVMKIKQIKKDLSDFILRITPFITELFYYFLSNLNIEDLKDVFIKTKSGSYLNVFEIKNDILRNEIFDTKLRNYIKSKKLENKYKEIKSLSLEIKNVNNIIDDLYKKIEVLFLKLKSDNNGFEDLFKTIKTVYANIKNPVFNKYKIIGIISDLLQYKDECDEIKGICDLYKKLKNKLEILDIANKYVSKNDYATIQYLLIIFKYYNTNYLNIYNLFCEFRDIESKIRNDIAHNLISITEDDIINKVDLISSEMILHKCDELFRLIFVNELSKNDIGYDGKLKFDYNCIINKDIEKLSKEPLEKYNEQ